MSSTYFSAGRAERRYRGRRRAHRTAVHHAPHPG